MNELDQQRLRQLATVYSRPGPRYTSYPTAVDFSDEFGAESYGQRLETERRRPDQSWSIYVHVPFCAERCDFCACSVIATNQHDRVAPPYLDALGTEMDLVLARVGERRMVEQLHLGGGTPTYLEPRLLDRLFHEVCARFEVLGDAEISVELDPRVTRSEHLDVLARHGVGRVSLGVQDLDPRVQSLIGRMQSHEQVRRCMEGARERGIDQVNVDLVYGLPGQSVASIERTADAVVSLCPDRIALYGYAHVPWMKGNQKRIDAALLPGAAVRLDSFLAARARFEAAGHVPIGFDHFARPDDPLARAAEAGTLKRNFMGYTTRRGADLLGFGVTAISEVADAYAQNTPKLNRYFESLRCGNLPTARGVLRTADDRVRARIIESLTCRFEIDRVDLGSDFSFEREALLGFIEDGLLENRGRILRLTELGRHFVRNVAMVFDARLRRRKDVSRFSATV